MITAVQMKELRGELVAAGVFRHHEAASWGKLGLLLAVLGLALAGTVLGPWWAALILVPIGSIVATTAAMLGHEGSHRSFSANPWRNQLLNYITFPLLSGLSASYWKHKHDGAHHGHPNVDEQDPDVKLWPMCASAQGHARSNRFRRWFQRNFQGYLFWPLTLFLPIMMRIQSVRHLIAHARRHGVGPAWFSDVACLVTHYAAWLVIPSLIWGLAPVLAVYLVLWTIVGGLLAMIFAPAHMGLPVIIDQNNDWQHQLETTRNLRLPKGMPYFFIGLDYQVEHHLFPKIPHQELPKASRIVAGWCARHGLPHQSIAYGPALASVTRFMRDAWKLPARTGADVRSEGAVEPLANAA